MISLLYIHVKLPRNEKRAGGRDDPRPLVDRNVNERLLPDLVHPLELNEPAVETVTTHESCVVAEFGNLPILENADAICLPDG